MLKYCDKDGIEKTIIDNENINDYVSGSGSGSGVSDEWKDFVEEKVAVHSKDIDSLYSTVGSHGNSIDSLNNTVNNLNARQNISVRLNGSTLYINW